MICQGHLRLPVSGSLHIFGIAKIHPNLGLTRGGRGDGRDGALAETTSPSRSSGGPPICTICGRGRSWLSASTFWRNALRDLEKRRS